VTEEYVIVFDQQICVVLLYMTFICGVIWRTGSTEWNPYMQ